MQKSRWWTVDTIFVMGLGAVMFVVLGASLFVRLGSTTGSDLVPATTLEKLREQEARRQTVSTDEKDWRPVAPMGGDAVTAPLSVGEQAVRPAARSRG
jgi:hypothetical protein